MRRALKLVPSGMSSAHFGRGKGSVRSSADYLVLSFMPVPTANKHLLILIYFLPGRPQGRQTGDTMSDTLCYVETARRAAVSRLLVAGQSYAQHITSLICPLCTPSSLGKSPRISTWSSVPCPRTGAWLL